MSDYEKRARSAGTRKKAVGAVVYGLLLLWAAMVLFPFYWMVLTSVKSYQNTYRNFSPCPLLCRIMRTLLPRCPWGGIC